MDEERGDKDGFPPKVDVARDGPREVTDEDIRQPVGETRQTCLSLVVPMLHHLETRLDKPSSRTALGVVRRHHDVLMHLNDVKQGKAERAFLGTRPTLATHEEFLQMKKCSWEVLHSIALGARSNVHLHSRLSLLQKTERFSFISATTITSRARTVPSYRSPTHSLRPPFAGLDISLGHSSAPACASCGVLSTASDGTLLITKPTCYVAFLIASTQCGTR